MILLWIILFSLVQSVAVKSYHKHGGRGEFFNILKSAAALLCMLAFSLGGFSLHIPTILYGGLYGLLLAISMYAGYRALSIGPLSLTSLISSFSVILPIGYGILFCREAVTLFRVIGFLLMAGAIVAANAGRKVGGDFPYKPWLGYILVTFLSNGFCSVVQKMYQMQYPQGFLPEFMTCAMGVCLLIFLAATPIKNYGGQKAGVPYALLAGVACALANYLTIKLAGRENASVMYPMISVGTVLAAQLYGRIVLKESFSKRQLAAIVSGIGAVFFLKL